MEKRLAQLKITAELWPVIMRTVDGCPRNELRARLDEAAAEAQSVFESDFATEVVC
jgi:hypothetical protein